MRIFGFHSNLIGDIVMSLPLLDYFEKLYPKSYKIFHIDGKCAQAAQVFINHALIDKIKISKFPESYDNEDYGLMKSCDLVINTRPHHNDNYWYNKRNCVEETALMTGVNLDHFNSILTDDEKYPKLNKWFQPGLFDPNSVGYCKEKYTRENTDFTKIIAIKPFSGYGSGFSRSPSREWWERLVAELIGLGYTVRHFGFVNEPLLSTDKDNYQRLTHLNFFDQVKAALDSKLSIHCDDGFAWILGAYSHKSVQLLCFWQDKHVNNAFAFAPFNKNAVNLHSFTNKCDDIDINKVLNVVNL
jgi:hypothetical protein